MKNGHSVFYTLEAVYPSNGPPTRQALRVRAAVLAAFNLELRLQTCSETENKILRSIGALNHFHFTDQLMQSVFQVLVRHIVQKYILILITATC